MQPTKKTLTSQRGHMEMGTPLLMIAILIVIAVSSDALLLPGWGFWSLVAVAALFAIWGVIDMLFGFKGMGHNALKHQRSKQRDD